MRLNFLMRLDGRESEQTLRDYGGQRSLVCCSPWGCKESDMTEQEVGLSEDQVSQSL